MKKFLCSIATVLFISACTSVDMNGGVVNFMYSEFSHDPPFGEAFEAPGNKVERYEDLTTNFRAEAMNITTGFKYHRGDAVDNLFDEFKTDNVSIRYCEKLSKGQCVLSKYNYKIFYKDLNDYKVKMGLVKPKIEIENGVKEKKYTRKKESIKTQEDLDKEVAALRKEQNEILEAKRKQKEKDEQEQLKNEKKEIVSTVQAFLYALGYAPGDEGEYDFRTQTAIKAYQIDTDMKPVDGDISEELIIKLQSSFSKKQNTIDFKNYSVVGSGSGYLVDNNGHVVTNEHVINGCSIITTGKNNTAELLRADETNDIAIIKSFDSEKYKAMSFANKDPALGQRIFVSGFPLNQILENLNFTSGTVSSEVGLMQNINQFQFTAPIQPGNSGGPILNENGGVIGMSVATVSNKKFEEMLDTLVQNMNFGIRQSSIQSLLDQEGIKYEKGNPNWFKNEESVAEVAKSGTMLIKCWTLNN
ncbi:trypsin-like peptidase domain-containing protein [Gammaproteobacteria bacterium]|nr:trypsin-like peptidase domain-containing protein [Gammaproteobacteria bacterium]